MLQPYEVRRIRNLLFAQKVLNELEHERHMTHYERNAFRLVSTEILEALRKIISVHNEDEDEDVLFF